MRFYCLSSYFLVHIFLICSLSVFGQNNYSQRFSVPTEIYVQDAYTKELLSNVTLQLGLGVNAEKHQTNDLGSLVLSLFSTNDYKILVQKEGYYTQITSLSMNGFSRTKKNRFGISLRPKDCFRVKGKINLPKGDSLDKNMELSFTKLGSNSVQKVKIQANQTYVFCGACNQEYLVTVNAEKFIPFKDTITLENDNCGLKKSSVFAFNLSLEPKEAAAEEEVIVAVGEYTKGDTMQLEGFKFKAKTAVFELEGSTALNNLYENLKKYPSLIVRLEVHTDVRKSHRYNWMLSEKRAEKIIEFLESKNIDKKQYTVVALGEEHPANRCSGTVRCSEAEHQVNNRIEIHVLHGDKDL